MNILPIVFCFDDDWEIPAGVCLTSLLENAGPNTFYDIFILYSAGSKFVGKDSWKKLTDKYQNCRITLRSAGKQFEYAFETRGITNSTYNRLLIPELIPEYNKIMYHDVDVIFREDLSEIFLETDVSGYYIAGVNSPGGLNKEVREKRAVMGLDWREYILAGNIILNSELLRNNGVVEQFKNEVMTSKYEHQDMDIINIVCKGKIKRMSPEFCGTVEIHFLGANQVVQDLYTLEELKICQDRGIIHYNGVKPWNSLCPNFDIWWQYYRKSIYYDPSYYFHFFSKQSDYDSLSLFKRVKILLRYFKRSAKK